MINLLSLGTVLSKTELKSITAGRNAVLTDVDSSGCQIGIGTDCPPGYTCEITTEQCIVGGGGDYPGGGGICPHNVGMNCDSPV